ncbi:Rubredoxin [Rhodovulum sp. PH10]|nr:Rubredoxin [Rhodovulum sp. PH10]
MSPSTGEPVTGEPAEAVGARLVSAYREVARTMRDLPVYNPRLDVEAVGFRLHDGHALGVLVTPWFMNIVLVAREGGPPLPDAALGAFRTVDFPAGRVSLLVGEVFGFGRLDTASLFSPMAGFDDPATARETAAAALLALFRPAGRGVEAPEETRPAKTPDRRALLFGRGA